MRQLITLSLLVLGLGLWACPSSNPENASSSETAPEAVSSPENSEAPNPESSPTEGKELINKMDFESGTTEEADAVLYGTDPQPEAADPVDEEDDPNDN